MHRSACPPRAWLAAFGAAVLLLAGCASSPPGRPAAGSDGVEANPPPDLLLVPDAEPRIEPIRPGGPNKPYEVLGESYTPIAADRPYNERGIASWYGRKFHGRRTASGEVYNMYAMTAAHPTLPIPSYVRVRNPANQREVLVRVNDRGPFHRGRIIDLSYTAALKLGVHNGVAMVEVTRLTHEEIRAGTWRREGDAPTRMAQQREPPAVAVTLPPVPVAALPADVAAPVPLLSPEPRVETARAPVPGAAGFWVQLGAFRDRAGAVDFQQRVAREMGGLSPLLAIFNEQSLHRLQAGPYPSRDEAGRAAQQVRESLQLVPVIVERK